ncbi:hypothetical protein ACFQE1_02120 [Halobium palmae]|uniref:Amphi-Trp domain-containing protein n=1 Tax=Halobium palmae TaxID=1776492 RepID=A0ABD5RVN0_9EURY
MSEKAEARIEAEFNDRSESPNPDGDKTVEVRIPSSGLEIDEVEEVDYVSDVIEQSTEYQVYVSASKPSPSFDVI